MICLEKDRDQVIKVTKIERWSISIPKNGILTWYQLELEMFFA